MPATSSAESRSPPAVVQPQPDDDEGECGTSPFAAPASPVEPLPAST